MATRELKIFRINSRLKTITMTFFIISFLGLLYPLIARFNDMANNFSRYLFLIILIIFYIFFIIVVLSLLFSTKIIIDNEKIIFKKRDLKKQIIFFKDIIDIEKNNTYFNIYFKDNDKKKKVILNFYGYNKINDLVKEVEKIPIDKN